MANNVFERKEIKYLVSAEIAAKIKDRLKDRMEIDGYGKAPIRSIYFDTPDFYLARRSIEKPLYKEKLRIRQYAADGEFCPYEEAPLLYVEMKKKFKGIVYKRRVKLSGDDAKALVTGSIPRCELSAQQKQVSREIAYMCERYDGIAPAVLIQYDREAWKNVNAEDDGVRITFDEKPFYEDLHTGKTELLTENIIMEIKVPGVFPLWLVKILSDLKVYPHSFTKYGTAYKKIAATA